MASVTFDTVVGGDGSTVTDGDDPSTGLGNGGSIIRLVPAFNQIVEVAGFTVPKCVDAVNAADVAVAAADGITQLGTATGLQTTGNSVMVNTASPPTTGQVLQAVSPTEAEWVSFSSGISNIVTATTATTLTSTKTLLRITPTKHGEWVKLPDATTCDLGGVLHIIDNKSPYHVRVLNSNGLLLGFIFGNTVSNVSLSDKTTAAGVWTIENSELYGISAVSPVISTFSAIIQVIAIDADREFILCTNSSSYPCGIVYNKTTNTFGSITVIRAVNTNNNNRCVLSGANQILFVSCPGSSTAFEAVTMTISGTSITVNAAATVTLSAGFNNGFPTVDAIIAVGSSFVTSYNLQPSVCQIRALTISGTTVTIGSASVVNGDYNPAIITNANNIGVIATAATDTNFYTNYYGISGTTITAGTGTSSPGSGYASAFKLKQLGSRWVCTIYDSTNGCRVGIISLSGTSTSISLTVAFNNSNPITDAIVVGSNKILLVRSTAASNVNIVTDVGGTATAGTPIAVTADGWDKYCLYVDGDNAFICEVSSPQVNRFFKIDCSGLSPVLINRLPDCGLNTTSTVVFEGGSLSNFSRSARTLNGSKFVTSLPVGAYSQNPLELFLIDGKVKIDVKKISITVTNLVHGKSDSERWIGSNSAFSLTKLECVA